MKPTEAVLFDLDGVLVDSKEVWYHLMRAAASDLGHPEVERKAFEDSFGQGVDADTKTFFKGSTFEEVNQYYDDHFMDHAQHFQSNAAGPKVLEDLRCLGVSTCVVTNTSTALAQEILERVGLKPDDLVGSTDVLHSKPAPDMVLLGLKRLQASAKDAVMVGDSPYDQKAAKKAQVRFLGFGGIVCDEPLHCLEDLLVPGGILGLKT